MSDALQSLSLTPLSPGDVVAVSFQNAGTGFLESGIATFGQTFKPGDMPANTGLVAKIDGLSVPVQIDVKTTYDDGSVKMAVVSIARPDLAAGAAVDVVLARVPTTTSGAALDFAQGLDGHSFLVDVRPQNGAAVRIDALDALRDALADGSASFWQKGPLATQARVEVPLEGSMRIVFDVTVFAGGGMSVDASFRNDRAMEAVGGRATYDVAVTMDGLEVARESVSQAQYQNWHRGFSSDGLDGGQGLGDPAAGWLNIRHDIAYLEQTGAIPKYDLAVTIPETKLATWMTAQGAATWDDPLATRGVQPAMPNTGGRPDIGFVTEANAGWLLSQDARAAGYALGQAETAGNVPWNFWDAKNGTWLNSDNYSKLWVDPRGGTGRPGDPTSTGLTQQVESSSTTGWTPDTSHQPELSFVPYLLTGERWILDGLQAQAAYNVTNQWHYRRMNDGKGDYADLVVNLQQVRGSAWSLREVQNAAWASPDGSVEKAYFEKVAADNWKWLISKLPEWTAMQGEAYGRLPTAYNTHTISPWMEDMFASTAIQAAERGSQEALTYLKWASNYLVGRFHAEDEGFAFRDGAAYHHAAGDLVTGKYYLTWEEMGAQTVARGESLGETKWMAGYYNKLAMATLAGIYRLTGDSDALSAYRRMAAESAAGTSLSEYGSEPQFAVTLPGIYSGTVTGTAGADNIVVRGAAYSLAADLGDGLDVLTLADGLNKGAVANVEKLIGGAGVDDIKLNSAVQGGTVDLRAGTDRLTLSNAGPNTLTVSNVETLIGGTAADAVTLGAAIQAGVADLGAGADRLVLSNAGPNTLKASNVETLIGGTAADAVTLATAIQAGVVDLGAGADRLTLANTGPNTLTVNNVETLIGGQYNDEIVLVAPVQGATLDLGNGADRLVLSRAGPNSLTVNRIETILGGAGNDVVTFGSAAVSNTAVDLGGGADRLVLAVGTNILTVRNTEMVTGGAGVDVITVGGPVAANLDGGAGADTLTGGDGADTILGGAHADALAGGLGLDRFAYKAVSESAFATPDTIKDFTAGTDLLVFTGLLQGAFAYRGASSFTASGNSEARFIDHSKQLQVDVNGDGTAEMAVTLRNVPISALSAKDFVWGPAGGGVPAPAPSPTPTLSPTYSAVANTGSAREGGSLSFSVTRDRDAAVTQTVGFAFGGTAASGEDYTAPNPLSVSFAPGEMKKTIALTTLADTFIEGTETVSLTITAVAGGGLVSSTAATASAALIDGTKGTVGNDTLIGGKTADAIVGYEGDDALTGGLGNDKLSGWSGADAFVYKSLADSGMGIGNRDVITDFQQGIDRIDLGAIDANAALAGDQSFTIGTGGQVTWFAEGTNTIVQIGLTPSGAPNMQIELTGRIALAASDFIL